MEKVVANNIEVKKHRNYFLLTFEIIACISIVLIHIRFPGTFGHLFAWFGRFGVPLFFVVAGYYMIQPNMDKNDLRIKMKKRLIHICALLLFSTILYLMISLIIERNDLPSFFFNTFSYRRLLYLLLFNRPLLSTHNWFLLAMIYVYTFIYLFPSLFLGNNRWLICIGLISVFTVFLNILVLQLDFSFLGIKSSDRMLFRNWLFYGLPFITLGILLKKNDYIFSKFKTSFVLTMLILSCILMMVEMYIYSKYLAADIEYCIFNITFVIAIIVLSNKAPLLFSKRWILNLKGSWTTYVYILHPAFITFVQTIITKTSLDNYFLTPYIKPVIVVLFSVFAAILINWLIVTAKKIVIK